MAELNITPTPPPASDIRRVHRSRKDRVIGGVCGGLGRYFGVDPVLLRVAAVALALSAGVGILAYIVAWVVIPEDAGDEAEPVGRYSGSHGWTLVVGAGLVALGGLLLARQLVPWFDLALFWPLVVVGVGLLVLTSARR
jgi:phage shock protein C